MINKTQLATIMPFAKTRIDKFLAPLNDAMLEFGINTPQRQAAFIAQIAHESGEFRYVKEIASGKDYDTGAKAKALGNTPEADGDGQKYKGRGLIQITGLDNYKACSRALFGAVQVLVDKPELLEEPKNACRSAAWFWYSKNLNIFADRDDFITLTKRINGGLNGLNDRQNYWNRAKTTLGVS